MRTPLPISCFLIVQNEADRLQRTLDSVVGLADEIVVVDSGSTDKTCVIAEAAGARVLHRDWQGFGPQKRFAEEQCQHDWVLNLDADEVLTPELADEIRALFQDHEPACPGYRFQQVTVYPQQSRPRLWADRHNYIRLYDRQKMRFSASPSHDAVEPNEQPVGQLSGIALHYCWRSLAHLSTKYDSYTDLQAGTLARKSTLLLVLRLFTEFPLHFFKVYILRRHFTGGWHGLQASAIIAWHRRRRIGKMLQQKRK
jgi:glycosyltransferase involved in cell wall biosynthesis